VSLMAGQLVATSDRAQARGRLLSRLAVPVLYFPVARRGRAAELQREGAVAMMAAEAPPSSVPGSRAEGVA
jgi:hypothetical protein